MALAIPGVLLYPARVGFARLKRFLFRREVGIGALIFISYYGLAEIGLQLATLTPSTSPMWPASGAAVALLSRAGRKYWPAVALGAFVANFQAHVQPVALALITAGNTLEGLLGSVLFDRTAKRMRGFFGAETLLAICFAAIIATPVSATFATGGLYFVGAIGRSLIVSNWFTWWTGDTLGILIFTPYFLRVFAGRREESLPSRRGFAVFLVAAAVAAAVFFPDVPMAWLFLVYPTLLLAVYTLSPAESGFITVAFSSVAVVATAKNYGPFHIGSTNENLLCLALFLASVAITEQGLQLIREMGLFRLSAGILFAGWAIGAFMLHAFNENEETIDRARFRNLVDATMAKYDQRAFLYESALRGGVGLFHAEKHVTPDAFRAYFDTHDIRKNYPGLLGFGYIEAVPDRELDAFVRRIRSENRPDFDVHGFRPEEDVRATGRDHFVVVASEPKGRNPAVLGLDIATEKDRYETALRSARTGRPEITPPIELRLRLGPLRGFLLFLPIFVEHKHFGWVYAPVVLNEFLGLGNPTNEEEIAFQVDFSENAWNRTRVFANAMDLVDPDAEILRETTRTLWGRTLDFHWYATTKFRSRHDTTSAWVIFASALVTLFLCAFMSILAAMTRKANELARRQAGEIQTQQAKLEHSSRLATLGEMAGGIAHEINNPLAILAGRAVLLNRLAESAAPNPAAIRKNAEKITETVERMAKIIRGLRTFSRNGERDPFRPAEISRIVSATLDFCSERFRNRQIEFRVAPAPDFALVCREVQIVQILLNLLNNAYDAVAAAPERWISLETEIASDAVRFVVTDSGSPIDPAVAANMMNPFFTTKPVGQGTGLGLSISSGIAEDHRGSLKYSPKDGRTRFILTIARGLVAEPGPDAPAGTT